MKIHVYVKYGHDEFGEYVETLYFPEMVPESENLEYVGMIDKSKVNLHEDTKTYI